MHCSRRSSGTGILRRRARVPATRRSAAMRGGDYAIWRLTGVAPGSARTAGRDGRTEAPLPLFSLRADAVDPLDHVRSARGGDVVEVAREHALQRDVEF